jgi:hypothetical protein
MIPLCLQKIIISYAYLSDCSFEEIFHQVDVIQDVSDSMSFLFLGPVVYHKKRCEFIPNPFREGYPFHCCKHIVHESIFSDFMFSIPEFLTDDYFQHKYKGVLLRKVLSLRTHGFAAWNKLFFNFICKLKKTDFLPQYIHFFEFFENCKPLQNF